MAEVLVSAEKRTERLQHVPVPVTAISGSVLADSNQIRIQDFYSKIPGLNLSMVGAAATPVISIRGVTTGGYTNPTVGIVVDDVAYGSTTSQGAGYSVADIAPSDLARVEVLRGPQGTLYGASSIGGLLKFVTVDPTVGSQNKQLRSEVSTTGKKKNKERKTATPRIFPWAKHSPCEQARTRKRIPAMLTMCKQERLESTGSAVTAADCLDCGCPQMPSQSSR